MATPHLYRRKRRLSYGWLAAALLVFGLIAGLFWFGFRQAERSVANQQAVQLEQALGHAIVSCYAVEGSYPSGVSYLEEHYGLVVDHNRYLIDYELAGANLYPTVRVAVRGEDLI